MHLQQQQKTKREGKKLKEWELEINNRIRSSQCSKGSLGLGEHSGGVLSVVIWGGGCGHGEFGSLIFSYISQLYPSKGLEEQTRKHPHSLKQMKQQT